MESKEKLSVVKPDIVFLQGEQLMAFQTKRLLETLTKRGVFRDFGYEPYVSYPEETGLLGLNQEKAEGIIRQRFKEREGVFAEEIGYWRKIANAFDTSEHWKVLTFAKGHLFEGIKELCG